MKKLKNFVLANELPIIKPFNGKTRDKIFKDRVDILVLCENDDEDS